MALDTATTDSTAAPAEASNDYEICISVTGGKISVGVESAGDEAAEGGEGDSGTPVGSIREAVAMAMEIYQNDGAMPEDADDIEFNSGFGKAKAAPKDKMLNEDM